MFRALVLSDSHRDYLSLAEALHLHREADAVFFLGDGESDLHTSAVSKALTGKKFTAVCGNGDFYSELPKEVLLPLGGKRFFALHGHTRAVKSGLQMLSEAAHEKNADIVLYGHTHIPRAERIDGIWFLCPGSIRNGAYGIADITDKGEVLCFTANLKGGKSNDTV